MARYSIEDTTVTNIANAIREKTGGTGRLQITDFKFDSESGAYATGTLNNYGAYGSDSIAYIRISCAGLNADSSVIVKP